ncbi:hypothetical protein [Lysinibacillus fusiformis]|uniref:hypothetical protein n=1 Tax=Lysinibacillus fusiformis TaxID=28031 RepID=UPI003D02C27E
MATDEQASILLHHLALPIVHLVHDAEIDEAGAALDRCTPEQIRQLCVLLAAMVDPNQSWTESLAWWLEPPAKVRPLHADEYAESPRPLKPSLLDVGPLVRERFDLPQRRAA